jgi:hypothetical protein
MSLDVVLDGLMAGRYSNQDQTAEDVRLVFRNAQEYNDPGHVVNKSAGEFLAIFEKLFRDLQDRQQRAQDLLLGKALSAPNKAKAHRRSTSPNPVSARPTKQHLHSKSEWAGQMQRLIKKVPNRPT